MRDKHSARQHTFIWRVGMGWGMVGNGVGSCKYPGHLGGSPSSSETFSTQGKEDVSTSEDLDGFGSVFWSLSRQCD